MGQDFSMPPDTYVRYFDSVSICLSKALGAPIGSVIAGSREFIDRVHRFRKMFGGGMRQVGIIAAAGIYALDHHIDRLTVFDISDMDIDPHRIVASLKERKILMIPFGKTLIRAVTHLDVNAEGIERAIEITAKVFSSLKRRVGANSTSRQTTSARG
jgi:threonine aldolase